VNDMPARMLHGGAPLAAAPAVVRSCWMRARPPPPHAPAPARTAAVRAPLSAGPWEEPEVARRARGPAAPAAPRCPPLRHDCTPLATARGFLRQGFPSSSISIRQGVHRAGFPSGRVSAAHLRSAGPLRSHHDLSGPGGVRRLHAVLGERVLAEAHRAPQRLHLRHALGQHRPDPGVEERVVALDEHLRAARRVSPPLLLGCVPCIAAGPGGGSRAGQARRAAAHARGAPASGYRRSAAARRRATRRAWAARRNRQCP